MLGDIVLIITLWASCEAYPSGAPTAQCTVMTPNHGANATSSAAPYNITVDTYSYTAGSVLTVTINGWSVNDTLQGLLLQARSGVSTTALGTFDVGNTSNVQQITCGTNNSAVTHNTRLGNVSSISVSWTAPTSASGDIEFVATLVKSKLVFWTGVKSGQVNAPVTTVTTVATTPTSTVSSSAPVVYIMVLALGTMLLAM